MKLIRARILLLDVEPEVWRLIEVDAGMTLDRLHAVIQVAMGWQNTHLHAFTEQEPRTKVSDNGHGPPRVWLTDFELSEGRPGLPENQTALGEILGEKSGPIFYEYDYGDDWIHRIEFIELIEDDSKASPAVLVRGQGACPPEDSGGAHGYMDLLAVIDKRIAVEESLRGMSVEELTTWADSQVGPWRDFDPEFLDPEAINRELLHRFPGPGDAPPANTALNDVAARIIDPLRMEFRSWLGRSEVEQALPISAEDAAEMIRPFSWLLDRIGADGIKLTQAGYMPPRVVSDLMRELGWEEDWIGKMNREDQTAPAMDLREKAMDLGLIRRHKGHLILARDVRGIVTDPSALLEVIAARLPSSYGHDALNDAVLAMLITISGGGRRSLPEYAEPVTGTLDMLGYLDLDGQPLDPEILRWELLPIYRDLTRLDVFRAPRHFGRDEDLRPTGPGVAFARLALRLA
ncbi:MAG: plasmid pRiA4b ORF-3 family protein [Thermoleophilia bacterium]|nr:plasmid pRiA4b ORF-3 family protein [Thermoleophilia bacterium]